jgi:hypothetical protein
VALMSLGVRGGDEVVIAGFHADAAPGVAEIARAIRHLDPAAPAPRSAPAASPGSGPVIASRGFVVGPAHRFELDELAVIENGAGAAAESGALERALDAVRAQVPARARGGQQAVRGV